MKPEFDNDRLNIVKAMAMVLDNHHVSYDFINTVWEMEALFRNTILKVWAEQGTVGSLMHGHVMECDVAKAVGMTTPDSVIFIMAVFEAYYKYKCIPFTSHAKYIITSTVQSNIWPQTEFKQWNNLRKVYNKGKAEHGWDIAAL